MNLNNQTFDWLTVAVDLLKLLEFITDDDGNAFCPICYHIASVGHKPDCQMGYVIKNMPKTAEKILENATKYEKASRIAIGISNDVLRLKELVNDREIVSADSGN